MKKQQKQAFTLVELIVVITILAILGTIAFISLNGYSSNARDSTRISDLNSIEKSLGLFKIKTGYFPEPSGGIDVAYSGGMVWNQGTIGESVVINLNTLSKKPVDPLTGLEYTYSRLNTKNEFQIAGMFEGDDLLSKSILSESYSAGHKIARAIIKGNYNGLVAKVNTGSTTYVLAVPTIISGDISLTDIIQLQVANRLVYNNYTNLPDNYKNSDYSISGDFVFNPSNIVVYSGSVDTLTDSTNQLVLISNLQSAYSGTLLKNTGEIETILALDIINNSSGSKTLAQAIINKNINKKVVVEKNINSAISNNLILSELNSLGGTGEDNFSSVIWDGTNYIAIGYSESDLTGIGSGTNTNGSTDFVIAKFDTNLNLIDLQNLGGTSVDLFNLVIRDGTNYVAVGFSDSDLTGIGSGSTNNGVYDFVIAKFDTNLNLIDLQNLGGTGLDTFNSVIWDGTNYIAVGNSISNLTGIGSGTTTAGSTDFIIAKFDTNLNLIDLQNLGGTNMDIFYSVIWDGTNYIAVGNSSSNLTGIGSGAITNGFNDFVIAKFDINLNLIDLQNLGGASGDSLGSIIWDGSNYIAVGNSGSDLTGIGSGTASIGSYDSIISKFDTNLNIIDLQNLGGASFDSFSSVVWDGTNYIATGFSQSDLTGIGSGTTTNGYRDFIITKFDTSLNLINLQNLGGTDADIFNSVMWDGTNYITVGTSESDLTGIGSGSTNNGSDDFVISKF